MKKFASILFAATCSAIILGSCSQDIWNESDLETPDHQTLSLTTRSDHPVNEGIIYLMNASGTCISLLESDNNGAYTSGSLAPSQYDLYAIGSDHLALFDLPTQEKATSTTPIHPKGETMGELLMTHQSLTLQEGQSLSLNLTLDRKVICLKEIQITQVPTEVTAVTATIAPLYPGILLDGSYDTESQSLTHTVQLDKTDTDTWSKVPNAMLFPSKGTPEITVAFTLPEGTRTYQFSPSEPFASNHQVCIHGTYKNDVIEPEIPVAEGTYKGYYVISVNETKKTAVLLAKTQKKGYSNETAVNNALKAWAAPEDVTGTWRIPTVAELTIWFNDRNCIKLEKGESVVYYCKDNKTLTTLELKRNYAGKYVIGTPSTSFIGASTWLAPVIDISY